MSSVTMATKVDEDSTLAEEFEEFKQDNSMYSKSEAIRTLLRAGLEVEYHQTAETSAQNNTTDTVAALSPKNLAYISVASYFGVQMISSSGLAIPAVNLSINALGGLILVGATLALVYTAWTDVTGTGGDAE